jgi:hypothetical protein
MEKNIWRSVTIKGSNKADVHWIKKWHGKSNNTTTGNGVMTTHSTWKFYSLRTWIIHRKKRIRVPWITIQVTNFQGTLGLIMMTYQHWIKIWVQFIKQLICYFGSTLLFYFIFSFYIIVFDSSLFENQEKATIHFIIFYFLNVFLIFKGLNIIQFR